MYKNSKTSSMLTVFFFSTGFFLTDHTMYDRSVYVFFVLTIVRYSYINDLFVLLNSCRLNFNGDDVVLCISK